MAKNASTFTVVDIQTISLFKEASDEILKQLLPECKMHILKRDKELQLITHGVQYMYYVRKGYLSTQYPTELLPWDTFFVGWRSPGHILGEMGVLKKDLVESEGHQKVKIKATDDCELWQLPANLFFQIAEASPIIYKNFTYLMIDKILAERKRAEVTQITRIKCRIAKTLSNLYEDRGFRPETNILKGTIRTAHIAGYTGASKDAVMENLKSLEEEGIILRHARDPEEGGTRKISILDLGALGDACYPY